MPLVLIFFLLLKGGTPVTEPTPVTPPTPALTISLERPNVRQKDCVNIELLMSNDSDVDLTNAELEVFGPGFFEWFEGPCELDPAKTGETGVKFGSPPTPSLKLGSLAARSPLTHQIHFHTGATINVGDYNVLFRIPYDWKKQAQTARAFVSAEKTVKVSFLGNESVAGIPMALAAFIVPGLLFWLIVKRFGAKWSVDGLSNQMIYSVMVSIALVVIGAWIGLWDLSSGISIQRLTTLAGVGAVLGLVAGGIDLMIRRSLIERQITRGETEFSLLGKMLELPSANRLEKPVITLKNGQEYSGSLGARTNVGKSGAAEQEIVSLVPSYKVDWGKITDPQLKAKMLGLVEDGKWRKFVGLANKHEAIDIVQQIEVKEKGGSFEAITEPFKQWEAAEVASTTSGSKTWTAEPVDTK